MPKEPNGYTPSPFADEPKTGTVKPSTKNKSTKIERKKSEILDLVEEYKDVVKNKLGRACEGEIEKTPQYEQIKYLTDQSIRENLRDMITNARNEEARIFANIITQTFNDFEELKINTKELAEECGISYERFRIFNQKLPKIKDEFTELLYLIILNYYKREVQMP